MSTTPAGWYDDGSGSQRWWDGRQWTEHTTPTPTLAQPSTEVGADEVSDRTVVRSPLRQVQEAVPAAAEPTVTSPPAAQVEVAPVVTQSAAAPQSASAPQFASGPQHVPPRRHRRASAYIAAVFYTVLAIAGAYLAVHTGQPKIWIATLFSGAYATYLWLGGRWVVFFF